MKILKNEGSYKKEHLILGGGMEITRLTGQDIKIFHSSVYIRENRIEGEYVLLTIKTPRSQHNITYLVWFDFNDFLFFLENDETYLKTDFEEIMGRE